MKPAVVDRDVIFVVVVGAVDGGSARSVSYVFVVVIVFVFPSLV